MDGADNGETVLRLLVAQRMAASEQAACLTHLLARGGEDLPEHRGWQALREGGDREREERRAAHSEDVVQGVRGGDRTEVAGVVDDGREEVEREDEGTLVVEAVDGGIVRGGEADEQVLGLDGDEAAKQLLEPRGRVLRGAAAGACQVGQPNGLHGLNIQTAARGGPPSSQGERRRCEFSTAPVRRSDN